MKKNKKQDRKLVAGTQEYEVDYISERFAVPKSVIRAAIKKVGHSRRKIYAVLRGKGYVIITK